MSVDKILRRHQMIGACLEELCQYREQMQWDGVLHPVNPMVRDLYQAQERLLTALERVLDAMPSRIAA